MGKIEEIKSYEGKDLETIFFRPMFCGQNAEELGIKVMYNMPVPTVLHFWRGQGNVLQSYEQSGWKGGYPADKYQKTIDLRRVKAEMGYSADDYFATVFELITNRADVNIDDLSGTELEAAETELFRRAIAENLRSTMWLGNTERDVDPDTQLGNFATFDGIYRRIADDLNADFNNGDESEIAHLYFDKSVSGWAEKLLKDMWENASDDLRDLKAEGSLVFFVTSDIYSAYEDSLDSVQLEAAYQAKQEGRESLSWRGIPLVDLRLSRYMAQAPDVASSFAILTDRRNMALAVNTSAYPGTEVRMWYNPDEMENRQRATFAVGCDYLLPELVSFAFATTVPATATVATNGTCNVTIANSYVKTNMLFDAEASLFDVDGEQIDISRQMVNDTNGNLTTTFSGQQSELNINTVAYVSIDCTFFDGSHTTVKVTAFN